MKRKIWLLIKKDISLCPEWLLAGIILALIMPAYVINVISLPKNLLEILFVLCGICAGNIVISRICYVEDNQAARVFLSSLPVSEKELKFSRYIVAIGMVLTFILFTTVMGIILGVSFNFVVLDIGLIAGMLYEVLYITVYYKWGNNVAQYTFVAFIAFIAVGILVFILM